MRILVVDFDIIMHSCIKLYDNRIAQHPEENPNIIWEMLENEFGLNKFMSYDSKILVDIARLIKKSIGNQSEFILVKTNSECLKDILSIENFSNITIDITNIDYHHGILKSDEQLQEVSDFDNYDSFSWIGYLFTHSKLDNYTWIAAPSSTQFISEKLKFDFNRLLLKDINSLNCEFDRVYFVRNDRYIPYKYLHLYDLIVELVSKE